MLGALGSTYHDIIAFKTLTDEGIPKNALKGYTTRIV